MVGLGPWERLDCRISKDSGNIGWSLIRKRIRNHGAVSLFLYRLTRRGKSLIVLLATFF